MSCYVLHCIRCGRPRHVKKLKVASFAGVYNCVVRVSTHSTRAVALTAMSDSTLGRLRHQSFSDVERISTLIGCLDTASCKVASKFSTSAMTPQMWWTPYLVICSTCRKLCATWRESASNHVLALTYVILCNFVKSPTP